MLGERLVDRVSGRKLKLCSVFFMSCPSVFSVNLESTGWSRVSSCSNFPSIFVCNLGKQLRLLMPSVKTPGLCVSVPTSFAWEKR